MDASDLEAPSGTQTCLGVSPAQPRILHPNWTLTYGLEHVCPVLYWNFSAGCEVRHRIWMHPTLKLPQEHRHVLGVTSSAADFTSELDFYVWPGIRMSYAVLEFQCRM